MPDADLLPVDPVDLGQAFAFALRFSGKKPARRAGAPNARIAAERLVEHLQAAETPPRGLVTASTLRSAAARGMLETERLGRRIVTTPKAIAAWRKKSRAPPRAPTLSQDARRRRLVYPRWRKALRRRRRRGRS